MAMGMDTAIMAPRPFSRPQTSQAKLNSWLMNDARPGLVLPGSFTDNEWKAIRARGYVYQEPLDNDFRQAYESLMLKLAYRHPQPGQPVHREGRVGSGWRHLKEIIGCGPGRLMWMDGVVTLYDQTETPIATQKPLPGRIVPNSSHQTIAPHFQSHSSDNDHANWASYSSRPHIERKPWYSNNTPQPLPAIFENKPTTDTAKFKGFYRMQQQYAA